MKIEPCEISGLESFNHYLASLSSPIDSFLENHLLESAFYRFILDGVEVGSFAIHSNTLLTQFYINEVARRDGQALFGKIIDQYKPDNAFVPTCDEFFLSHALDKHTALKNQAYFFVDSTEDDVPTSTSLPLEYKMATSEDLPVIQAIKNSILDNPADSIDKREVYVGYLENEMVAIGLIVPSTLWRDRASIGLLTIEGYRQKGIGTQTILFLKQMCRDMGFRPLAGCAYGNINSRLTLQAAGMLSNTRLLKITF